MGLAGQRERLPRQVGRYVLHEELASGGMAVVYFGQLLGPIGFTRVVAIKRMREQFALDARFVRMFVDEAWLAARVQHPNVVSTLDVVAHEGELFIVLEFVRGEALSALLKASAAPVPPGVAASIVGQSLSGLHAAHEAKDAEGRPLGMIHRDVSPQNVLVGVDGLARITDFGIAKAARRLQVTQDKQIKGKLRYMSGEQIVGDAGLDRRADVYAMGVVLWEMLAGSRMVRGDTVDEILRSILEGEPPRIAGLRDDVPRGVDEVISRAVAPLPADRFATADEFQIALEKVMPFASTRAVGEWVQRVAGDRLRTTAAIVDRIEQAAPSRGAISGELRELATELDAAPRDKFGFAEASPTVAAARDAATAVTAGGPHRAVAGSAPQRSSLPSETATATVAGVPREFEDTLAADSTATPGAPASDSVPVSQTRLAPKADHPPTLQSAESRATAARVLDDRFEVGERVGAGGMGTVYRGVDRTNGEAVAIKLLSGATDVARFRREWGLLRAADHPEIVRYVAHGTTPDGVDYLITEWLEGETLADHADRAKRLPIGAVVELGVRLAEAVASLHDKGIIHRDIKPANVFLVGGDLGRIKVLDFGLARTAERAAGTATGVTVSGVMLGTPGYMAPEQARGELVLDARVDVFSMGCVLFRCLAGHTAFAGDDALTVLLHTLLADRDDLERALTGVPAKFRAVLLTMLSPVRDERPADAGALVEPLRAAAAALSLAQAERVLEGASAMPPRLGGSRSTRSSSRTRVAAVAGAIVVASALVAIVASITARRATPGEPASNPTIEALQPAPPPQSAPEEHPVAAGTTSDSPAPVGSPSKVPGPPARRVYTMFSRAAVEDELAGRQGQVKGCLAPDEHFSVAVAITFDPSGRSFPPNVSCPASRHVETCVQQILTGAHTAPFDGPQQTVSHVFTF